MTTASSPADTVGADEYLHTTRDRVHVSRPHFMSTDAWQAMTDAIWPVMDSHTLSAEINALAEPQRSEVVVDVHAVIGKEAGA